MALSSKSPNAIFMEIRKLSLCAAPPPIRGALSRGSSFQFPPFFPLLFLSREKKKIRASREFDSHLIVPRLIGDRGFHCWHNEALSANLSRRFLTSSAAFGRKETFHPRDTYNNCSRNTRVALLATKIKSHARTRGRRPSMKVETWLAREVDG